MYKAFFMISMHPNFLCSTPVQHAAVSTSTAHAALSASASAALPGQLAAELQIANQAPEQTAEPASVCSSHVR